MIKELEIIRPKSSPYKLVRIGGNNDGELIYTALDWEHPPILQLDPPLIISDGQGLKLKVTYNNWRNEDVEFGFFSTDEMMILFGHFYAN